MNKEDKSHWIVTARQYQLDTDKWEIMSDAPIDCCKLVIDRGRNKFTGQPWKSRSEKMKDVQIFESLAMQGSFWIMPRSHWDSVIKELQEEGYGTHQQDSHEMVFKTWQAGGKLMINKGAWFAHRHRKFGRTHHYSGALAQASFDYCMKVWGDYYQNTIRPLWKI